MSFKPGIDSEYHKPRPFSSKYLGDVPCISEKFRGLHLPARQPLLEIFAGDSDDATGYLARW